MQKNDYWKTPKDLLSILYHSFVPEGGIFCDICPDQKDYEEFVAGCYHGIFSTLSGQDALEDDLSWPDDGVIFMNPPYSGKYKEEFIDRAIYENFKQGSPIIALFPASVETTWFKKIEERSALVWYLGKRVSFVDPASGKAGAGNRTGSVIFILDSGRRIVNKNSVEKVCYDNPYGGYGYYKSEEVASVGFHFRMST